MSSNTITICFIMYSQPYFSSATFGIFNNLTFSKSKYLKSDPYFGKVLKNNRDKNAFIITNPNNAF